MTIAIQGIFRFLCRISKGYIKTLSTEYSVTFTAKHSNIKGMKQTNFTSFY